MSKYEAVYFVGNNKMINRVRVDSSKMRYRGAFSGSLAALVLEKFRGGREWVHGRELVHYHYIVCKSTHSIGFGELLTNYTA